MTQKKLTVKQTKFVKAYVATGEKAEAYKRAYNTKGNPETIYPEAVRTASLPQVKLAIEQALAKHEITVDAAVQPIADGLKAERMAVTDSGVEYTPDHSVRLKASSMALKLMGADNSDKGNSVTFNFKGGANFNAGEFRRD